MGEIVKVQKSWGAGGIPAVNRGPLLNGNMLSPCHRIINYSAISYSMAMQKNMAKKERLLRIPARDPGAAHTMVNPSSGKIKKRHGIPHKTSIQVSGSTKINLDRVKQEADVETYEDAIRFLLEEQKRHRPSTFGLLSGGRPFIRDEEEDSHRIRH
jgi:hypothetical protein